MTFKQLIPLAVAACIAPCFAESAWLTDMETAKKQAAEQNKGILIEFTGSDWCPPCKQLRQNVMSKEEFQKKAGENFILLELDYPQNKDSQTPEVRAANEKIAQQYQIEGFPTIIFTDANGLPFGGFVGGKDEAAVISEMNAALETQKAMKAALAQVAQIEGDEAKLDALLKVWAMVPEEYDFLYSDLKDMIKSLDKNDKSGLKAADELEARRNAENVIIKEYLQKNSKTPGDPNEFLELIRSVPGRDQFLPEIQQILLMSEFQALLAATGDVEKVMSILDQAKAIDPNSEIGQGIDELKKRLSVNKDKIKARFEENKKQQEAVPVQ